jgi:histidinol-phosphate phosphatase family protein
MREVDVDVVIPTVGRPSLEALLEGIAAGPGPLPGAIIIADDRPRPAAPLAVRPPPPLSGRVRVISSGGRGPAAARNVGIAVSQAEWVCFVDDDVVPERGWRRRLAEDLDGLSGDVAGCQGRVEVPLPPDRAPTDWERNVAGLGRAAWATADMAYRRAALMRVGGFDERFPRAYREDADLALRLLAAAYVLVRGERTVRHPVRPADRWVSLRMQAGNADDAMMRRIHGRGWRRRALAPPGRYARHAAATALAAGALGALVIRRRRIAGLAVAGWAAATAELAWARIAPGPRDWNEVATMLLTTPLLPPLAVFHRLRGWVRAARWSDRFTRRAPRPSAVLLDRDGTLVLDVPYNGDPRLVRPVPGSRAALDRLRAAGLSIAVVSNQSAIARGLVTAEQVGAVNSRIEDLLGPVGPWVVCPHAPEDGCACRKPAPGLVVEAARRLGVDPSSCVVIGDTEGDLKAAQAAGARAILVPNAATRPEEIARAPLVAASLEHAVAVVLGERE